MLSKPSISATLCPALRCLALRIVDGSEKSQLMWLSKAARLGQHVASTRGSEVHSSSV